MGDRVIFQVRCKGEVSPAIYCHWAGSNAPAIVRRLAKRMDDRRGDVSYAAARLVQECTNDDDGALSFGIWNEHGRPASQGDAGVVLIDADTFRCECYGGYLKTGDDGFPV